MKRSKDVKQLMTSAAEICKLLMWSVELQVVEPCFWGGPGRWESEVVVRHGFSRPLGNFMLGKLHSGAV